MRRRWPIACTVSPAENCCIHGISPVPSETVSVPFSAPWLAAAGTLISFLGSLLIKLASLKVYLQFEALGLGLAGGVARVEFIQFMFLRLSE